MKKTVEKELLIIGAGPAGLKAAQEAEERGIDYLVLEKGAIGQAWKEIRPDLPMLSPCHPQRDWTSFSNKFPIWKMDVRRPFCSSLEFCQYMDAFSDHFNLQIETQCEVLEINHDGEQFIVFSRGKTIYKAPLLLLATGIFGNPFIPQISGARDNPYVMHSHLYRSADHFKGQCVLVIGAGNSAAETAIDLTRTAMVYLVSRKNLQYFSDTQKLYHIRGISESFLKELIKMELVRYKAHQEIQYIDNDTVYFKDWKLKTHKIIFATGYHGHIDVVKNFKLRVNKSNYPEVSYSGESIQFPNLFFAGPLSFQNTASIVIHGFIKHIPITMDRIQEILTSERMQVRPLDKESS